MSDRSQGESGRIACDDFGIFPDRRAPSMEQRRSFGKMSAAVLIRWAVLRHSTSMLVVGLSGSVHVVVQRTGVTEAMLEDSIHIGKVEIKKYPPITRRLGIAPRHLPN